MQRFRLKFTFTFTKHDFYFVISQSKKDSNILTYIKNNLEKVNKMLQSKKNKIIILSFGFFLAAIFTWSP